MTGGGAARASAKMRELAKPRCSVGSAPRARSAQLGSVSDIGQIARISRRTSVVVDQRVNDTKQVLRDEDGQFLP